jgi:flagellar motility protein MotE (MotC chaperone)
MDYTAIETLRERHPAWRLLRADNASLVLSFLGRWFVEDNRGATPATELIAALDDELHARNADHPDEPPFPKRPRSYLEDWAAPERGWLRSFYPASSDEVHYEATSAFEKAYSWTVGLRARDFVGTESRLHTVVELLRQIVHGTDDDPEVRLAVLRERRAELDRQIEQAEAGHVDVLGETAVRDRYQQFASTARELLSDFREVGEKFRDLDRQAREKIASWDGAKGDLLAELVTSRADIGTSDQGASFQAFYDLLLSEHRQDELGDLLRRTQQLDAVSADQRLTTVHHDWAEAAERTQRTVRQISEQLRRFLDDQVWIENRRVVDLVRAIEGCALTVKDDPPDVGLELDVPGLPIALPMERPLYVVRESAEVDSMLAPVDAEELDLTALLAQTFVDRTRLADNLRALVPEGSAATLSDIVAVHPIEQGAAEIVGYLSIDEDDLRLDMDESVETVIDYVDAEGSSRRVRMPRVTVSRG